MIVKFFELKKKNLKNFKYYLFYGNNRGLIEETLKKTIIPITSTNIFRYDELEVIKNYENFYEDITNKSFFESEKLIIISRVTDKILNIIEDIIEKNLTDVTIVLLANILEKKSKLRNYFEKSKITICAPFYEDNEQSLNMLALTYLKEKKIPLSPQNVNLIVARCKGDRINLYNELEKIEIYSKGKKKIEIDEVLKLTNLSENFDVHELVDNTLAKNRKKTLYILNENNFVSEDTILITRIFLNKLKRLLEIQKHLKIKDNIEEAITSFKPPIFWKDKEVIKKQLKNLDYEETQLLIIKTNQIELLIKKNPTTSLNIVMDFIMEQTL